MGGTGCGHCLQPWARRSLAAGPEGWAEAAQGWGGPGGGSALRQPKDGAGGAVVSCPPPKKKKKKIINQSLSLGGCLPEADDRIHSRSGGVGSGGRGGGREKWGKKRGKMQSGEAVAPPGRRVWAPAPCLQRGPGSAVLRPPQHPPMGARHPPGTTPQGVGGVLGWQHGAGWAPPLQPPIARGELGAGKGAGGGTIGYCPLISGDLSLGGGSLCKPRSLLAACLRPAGRRCGCWGGTTPCPPPHTAAVLLGAHPARWVCAGCVAPDGALDLNPLLPGVPKGT